MQTLSDNRVGSNALFHAKILLFGEYSVIFDSSALSMPFDRFNARFSLPDDNSNAGDPANESNNLLKEYCYWLEQHEMRDVLLSILDVNAFRSDIEKGLFFKSDIPQGYGLGSSGALCAAVYDRYAFKKTDIDSIQSQSNMQKLKNIFSLMESWFHGISSGLDPLICYFGQPLHVEPGERISVVNLPWQERYKDPFVFLLDTGTTSKTGPLVTNFIEKCRRKYYFKQVTGILIPAVNNCISSLLNDDFAAFMPSLKQISEFQMKNMIEMIPDRCLPVWEKGLSTDDYYLKFCGSGGGGYLLGFSNKKYCADGIAERNSDIQITFL